MNIFKRPVFWTAVIIAVAVVAGLLGACGDPMQPAPVACATYLDKNGVWREEDHERIDADPCDLDDLFELRTTAAPKPVPKASPAKKSNSTTTTRKPFR